MQTESALVVAWGLEGGGRTLEVSVVPRECLSHI